MKEELRKEYFNMLGMAAPIAERENPELFDWFYSKLEAKDKECASKIAAGERLRVEDAMSAINEANGLCEKIKDQELIIYGIEEGAEQWKSLCAEKDKEIAELREYKRLNTIGLSGYTPEELHEQIADLKAKLEAAKTALGNIRGELYSRDDSTSVHKAISKILEDNGFPWEPED